MVHKGQFWLGRSFLITRLSPVCFKRVKTVGLHCADVATYQLGSEVQQVKADKEEMGSVVNSYKKNSVSRMKSLTSASAFVRV